MRVTILLIALLATSSGAFAAQRSDALSPFWQNNFESAQMTHSAIVRTGPGTYDRVVRDQSQCDRDEQLVPVWSRPGYYTCEEEYN
jgi:hypothetical protein